MHCKLQWRTREWKKSCLVRSSKCSPPLPKNPPKISPRLPPPPSSLPIASNPSLEVEEELDGWMESSLGNYYYIIPQHREEKIALAQANIFLAPSPKKNVNLNFFLLQEMLNYLTRKQEWAILFHSWKTRQDFWSFSRTRHTF